MNSKIVTNNLLIKELMAPVKEKRGQIPTLLKFYEYIKLCIKGIIIILFGRLSNVIK